MQRLRLIRGDGEDDLVADRTNGLGRGVAEFPIGALDGRLNVGCGRHPIHPSPIDAVKGAARVRLDTLVMRRPSFLVRLISERVERAHHPLCGSTAHNSSA